MRCCAATTIASLHVAAGFSADEWAAPSLCDEWTNHQVLAHLVVGYAPGSVALPRDTSPRRLVRPREHRDGLTLAAAASPARTARRFARLAHRPRGLGRIFPTRLLLGDHITHELDMLFALDRDRRSLPTR